MYYYYYYHHHHHNNNNNQQQPQHDHNRQWSTCYICVCVCVCVCVCLFISSEIIFSVKGQYCDPKSTIECWVRASLLSISLITEIVWYFLVCGFCLELLSFKYPDLADSVGSSPGMRCDKVVVASRQKQEQRVFIIDLYYCVCVCVCQQVWAVMFAWPCIIDINHIDNQLDARVTVY